MLSCLKLRRRPSIDALPRNPPPPVASEAPALPPASLPPTNQPAHVTPRRGTLLHTIPRYTKPVFQTLTLAIPLALVVLAVYVHISAYHSVWRELNNSNDDPCSTAWAPFWLTITYVWPLTPVRNPGRLTLLVQFLLFIPWWSIVWTDNRRARHKKTPLLSRGGHVLGGILEILVTVLALLWTVYFSRKYELVVVGFPYVTVMTVLFGAQL